MIIRNNKWGTQALLATVVAVGILTAAASEGATITFDQGDADEGTVSYDGTAGGILIGTDILFTSIVGTGTDNDTTIDCDGCFLNFNSGALISVVGNVYTFAGGGFFDVIGGSILGGIAAGSTLVDGEFDGPVVVTVTSISLTMITSGTDTKDPELLDFFFATPPGAFSFIESTIQIESEAGGVIKGPGTRFTADLALGGDADLVNSTAVAVPTPGTTALFLLGLTGLSAYRRRRQ